MRTVCLRRQPIDCRLVRLTIDNLAQRQMATLIYCNKYPRKLAGQVIFDIAEKTRKLLHQQHPKRVVAHADDAYALL